ncbi:MAG TPA: RluA family pseudouridine synthase [Stellaceae bacterium]|nr:RluA family pseudouridine synthase [Stellaceae bacterium]
MSDVVTVGEADGTLRLDRWFRRHYPGLGHGHLEKLLRTGQIRVDGRKAKSGERVSPGMAIRVPPLAESSGDAAIPASGLTGGPRARPQDEALLRDLIIHRDEHAIVLNKPAGLAVQGGSNTARHVDGMLDGLRFDHAERPRLVHRLDKDTSGVLLIARSAAAAAFFTRAFRDKTTRKTYWAIVAGLPKLRQGRIDLSLVKGGGVKGPGGRERVHAGEDGKDAVTYYTVVDSAGDRASWLALLPLTGRTHQLRAHCAAIGTPILGDGKYGGAAAHALGSSAAHRLHLHARSLEIPHPAGFVLKVTAPLPAHMWRMWEFLGFAGDAPDPFAELELPA